MLTPANADEHWEYNKTVTKLKVIIHVLELAEQDFNFWTPIVQFDDSLLTPTNIDLHLKRKTSVENSKLFHLSVG